MVSTSLTSARTVCSLGIMDIDLERVCGYVSAMCANDNMMEKRNLSLSRISMHKTHITDHHGE